MTARHQAKTGRETTFGVQHRCQTRERPGLGCEMCAYNDMSLSDSIIIFFACVQFTWSFCQIKCCLNRDCQTSSQSCLRCHTEGRICQSASSKRMSSYALLETIRGPTRTRCDYLLQMSVLTNEFMWCLMVQVKPACQDDPDNWILAGGATCCDILKRALLQAKGLVYERCISLCAYLDSDSACS